MAYQENNGWPLGLRTLNLRAGLIRNENFSGSISFSTLFTASDRLSSVSSSENGSELLPSVSTHRSRTLGSLIGIGSLMEFSNRPINFGSATNKRSVKIKDLFSLCLRNNLDVNPVGKAPSLGRFLELERKAKSTQRRAIPDYL